MKAPSSPVRAREALSARAAVCDVKPGNSRGLLTSAAEAGNHGDGITRHDTDNTLLSASQRHEYCMLNSV